MSETPRLRSAFPATPRTDIRTRNVGGKPLVFASSSAQSRPSPITKPVQKTTPVKKADNGPLIPLDVVDAPTQRLYVAAFYFGLLAWRLYNALNVTDELDSTWLFLKWLAIDAALFVALPAFRIPWLEWSFATTVTMWLLHVIANAFLMYKIPIPVISWLGAMVKVAYDRELGISDNRVKPADIIHNSSIILGKQIIQILPEGSAILNPERHSFCLDSTRTSADLSIQINQTTPISIELVRYDLDSAEAEPITISKNQVRKLRLIADKKSSKADSKTPRTLQYTVSKPGLYRLTRVIDETKLEVRKRSYDVAVVACPTGSVSAAVKDKCTGDLSGVSLNLVGIPPFKIKYSKRIDHRQSSSITQMVQGPEPGDVSDSTSDALVGIDRPDMRWMQPQSVSVEINESLHQNGTWSYLIEEIEDGLGNIANTNPDKVKKAVADGYRTAIIVHGRPIITLKNCDSQHPLRVAEGITEKLPVQIKSPNQIPAYDWPMTLRYTFTPDSDESIAPIEEETFELSSGNDRPLISKAGRYNLQAITSRFCRGEVNEPSSCVLQNPPRPAVSMDAEVVADKCAGNPIGMIVNLDFTGTPPFTVRYTKTHGRRTENHAQTFQSMRGKLVFQENSAGSYVYQLVEIKDHVYSPVSLKGQDLVLKQDIKPEASARFEGSTHVVKKCQGETVTFPVAFQGEGPWDLEYELVHGGKRKKFSVHSEGANLNIELPELNEGGKYSLVLTGVQDKTKCRNALTMERDIEIRAEQASAAFGDIDGQRTVKTQDGNTIKVPIRLRGIAPWRVQVRNIDKNSSPQHYTFHKANEVIDVKEAGTYEIMTVQDTCPGIVDPKMNIFTVNWIPRPSLLIKDPAVEDFGKNKFRKAAVCQGYEDHLSLSFTGTAPFNIRYKQNFEPLKGHQSTRDKSLSAANVNAIVKLDTSTAGEYTYIFNDLEDDRYRDNKRHFNALTVKQQVHPLPTAKFSNSGKTYGYCKEDSKAAEQEMEIIPLVFTGTPPFSVEIAIMHHGISQRPEIKRLHDIPSNSFSWSVPRSSFELGTHNLQIRSVKDGRGCESTLDMDASSVRVHVSAPPTINSLDSATDYCVGDRVSFSLSGQAPFDIFYSFQGRERKAQESSHEFKRITDAPGDFVITGISDSAMGGGGKCKARKDIRKTVHSYPSVRIEKGKTKINDIHEGGEVDIHFEFTGTPPFEFTFIRSENISPRSKSKNKKPAILETRHETSNDYRMVIQATEEGTYEVVAIKDRYCAYSASRGATTNSKSGQGGQGIGWRDQKLIKN